MRVVGDDESEGETPERRRRGIFLLPNLLTTGGIFAGFFSIVAAIDGNFAMAAWATIIAFILDGMDGRVARLTNTESDFGKEYDSLADMVSFGVAPAIITYQWGVVRLAEYGVLWGRVGWLATFLYAVAAAFRLARFNTSTQRIDQRYFEGVPSPPAAVAVVAMVWLASDWELTGLAGLVAGICVTAIVGLLMVSRFRYYSFKSFRLSRRVRFANLLLIPLGLILISLAPPVVFFFVATTYVCSGPVNWILRHLRRPKRQRRLDGCMNSLQQQYLTEIGIDVWVERGAAAEPAELSGEAAALVDSHALTDIGNLGWDELRSTVSSCTACALHSSRKQTVFGVGDPQAQLLVIGEAPGGRRRSTWRTVCRSRRPAAQCNAARHRSCSR